MNPIIVALDFDSAAGARELVDKLGNQVSFYKVGLELYAAAGMEFASLPRKAKTSFSI
jgi:orotidine-5'-phosphate decarboxylase